MFTADPAPLVYRDTLFLYTGHDTASVQETNYKLPDWRIYSTTDMVHWRDYGTRLSPRTFHKKDAQSQGGAAIGAAVADRPTGPFKDAIGRALIVNEMTTDKPHTWDDIDPTVFIDADKQAYLYWGNGSCRWVKLKDNLTELAGPITTFTPKNYIEGPWVYKRNKLYYLVYAGAGTKPEMIEYCTAPSATGPWTYRGIIQENVPNSFTTHPGIVDYKGKSYFFYHNGALPTGGSHRRSICVDDADGSIRPIVQTTKGVGR